MDQPIDNPFSVNRAADFTDEQIYQYWVDLDGGGFEELLKPRSEMPMLILGSKGSGKTHIMRYLSFPLQQIRHASDLTRGIERDGYVGIYMRCSGLNSARFRDKGHSDDVWAQVFAYYMELWLSQMAIEICRQLATHIPALRAHERTIASEVQGLFDLPVDRFPFDLHGLEMHLRDLQKELDVAINNCGLDGTLNITIRATSGKLIFGIPKALSAHLGPLSACVFLYLIDEYENLTESQQKFINTLLREKQSPSSFKVGARLYGMHTYSTYCADEDIKEGSEYEQLPLDLRLRKDETRYGVFARRLVIKRLATRGILVNPPQTDHGIDQVLTAAFGTPSTEGLAELETRFVVEKYMKRPRPYFRTLRQALEQGLRANATVGIASETDINTIIEALVVFEYPLLEKLNCFLFYQYWSAKEDLKSAADGIGRECREYVSTRNTKAKYHDTLLHFKYDLLAQLFRECGRKQVYAGLNALVELSWGNPRHLLILLKHIFSWAAFKDEHAFEHGKPISTAAQSAGVKEAAEWFFRDVRIAGQERILIQDSLKRLGTLFRSIRYSHKPSECSLSSFSYDPASVSTAARRFIDLAEKWSLLVDVGGQRDRNSERVDCKLQVNRMLAPLWDISFSRRGVLALSGDDVNAMFDPHYSNEFDDRLKVRVARMTAPFFGARPAKDAQPESSQGLFPDVDDD